MTSQTAFRFPSMDLPRGQAFVLDQAQRVHLLGAGGAGVSGAARLLHARGHTLTGHDRERSPFSAALEELGVPIQFGASNTQELPGDAQVVLRSAAIAESDPQMVAARERGLTIHTIAVGGQLDLLEWLAEDSGGRHVRFE